jgi:plasmid stabilization system protein ParE
MNYVPVFRPIVQPEIDEAYQWYERQREELGDEFLDCVGNQIALICQMPEAYPIIYRDIRRSRIKLFPYVIYYRIVSSRVIITAVFHTRRNPKDAKARN